MVKLATIGCSKPKKIDFYLNFLKGPPITYLVISDFGMSKVVKKQRSIIFIGARRFELDPISGVLCEE